MTFFFISRGVLGDFQSFALQARLGNGHNFDGQVCETERESAPKAGSGLARFKKIGSAVRAAENLDNRLYRFVYVCVSHPTYLSLMSTP